MVGGGFLIGADLTNSPISTYVGGVAVATGLFLGLRVLWKFSSELKDVRTQIDIAMKKLKDTERRMFGMGGSTVEMNLLAHPFYGIIGKLKQKVDELEHKVDQIQRGRRAY